MTSPCSHDTGKWVGVASTSVVPPADYWAYLAGTPSDPQVEQLKQQSDARVLQFNPSALRPPRSAAVELLERVANDGWLQRNQRRECPKCNQELSEEEAAEIICPHLDCGEAFSQYGGVKFETVYDRTLAPTRDVDWVIAIHGMNTHGDWQEAFSWHLSTTWGRSVPVAVYKYGKVIAGVLMTWRRRSLQNNLRAKLATLRDQAQAQGFSGKPDVIAHSFGTWLFGHLIADELTREPKDQLRFGRIILTGCVLRPDFDWERVKEAKLVDDVLNHYGTKDPIVPLAHATIWDSGPSGRRGFDGHQVLNIRAKGYGHSDLFSIKKCVVDGNAFQKLAGNAGAMRHLEHSYTRYWRPFLTLPRAELDRIPDRLDPPTAWRQLPWPLRGTLFPFAALPLVLVLIAFLAASVGRGLWELQEVSFNLLEVARAVGTISLVLLVLIMIATSITLLCRLD